MSTITTYPRAASQAGKTRFEQQLGSDSGFRSDEPGHSDTDMMYAWSIGVTSAVRELEPVHGDVHSELHEECPPEVYIG